MQTAVMPDASHRNSKGSIKTSGVNRQTAKPKLALARIWQNYVGERRPYLVVQTTAEC